MSNLTGLQDFVEWDVRNWSGRNPVLSAHKCVPRPLPTLCPACLDCLADHHFSSNPSGSSSHSALKQPSECDLHQAQYRA